MSGAGDEDEDNKPIDLLVPIILEVSGLSGCKDFFRIKKDTKLKKLMDVYCETKSVVYNRYVFLFDGRRLLCDQTPNELRLQNRDVIYAVPHQPGPLANLNAFRYKRLANGNWGYDLCCEASN